MRNSAGFFLSKIQHLKSKKLIILDEADVEQKLKFISFHRINGYTLGFREDKTDYSSNFICGTTFMANILSDRHTPYWYTNFTLFSPSAKYETDIFPTIVKLKEVKETFSSNIITIITIHLNILRVG